MTSAHWGALRSSLHAPTDALDLAFLDLVNTWPDPEEMRALVVPYCAEHLNTRCTQHTPWQDALRFALFMQDRGILASEHDIGSAVHCAFGILHKRADQVPPEYAIRFPAREQTTAPIPNTGAFPEETLWVESIRRWQYAYEVRLLWKIQNRWLRVFSNTNTLHNLHTQFFEPLPANLDKEHRRFTSYPHLTRALSIPLVPWIHQTILHALKRPSFQHEHILHTIHALMRMVDEPSCEFTPFSDPFCFFPNQPVYRTTPTGPQISLPPTPTLHTLSDAYHPQRSWHYGSPQMSRLAPPIIERAPHHLSAKVETYQFQSISGYSGYRERTVQASLEVTKDHIHFEFNTLEEHIDRGMALS